MGQCCQAEGGTIVGVPPEEETPSLLGSPQAVPVETAKESMREGSTAESAELRDLIKEREEAEKAAAEQEELRQKQQEEEDEERCKKEEARKVEESSKGKATPTPTAEQSEKAKSDLDALMGDMMKDFS
mmetsp:Transcript_49276/g.77934  ORF Transcript_49276/g.77934 Transcript_49276/m.77934 type:complete len:129 (-) Transcript_49276:198-584(-)